MSTPFDKVIKRIGSLGYHNHRLEAHSDIVSEGIVKDLLKNCEPFRQDFRSGVIGKWLNARAPGARGRKIDLFIGEPEKGEKVPNVSKLRICVENKSVVTAHRNRGNRFDVPVHIDNVNSPRIARKNAFGIDVEKEYKKMIDAICKAYRARWHL